MHTEYKSQLLAQGLPISHRDMVINGGNLPESPLPNTVPLAAVHSNLVEVATELQTFVADLLASLEGSPASFALGDHAGDIRGNACHLWNLLVAVNDNSEDSEDGEISTAFDPCVKCGEVAPLDIHGVCIACELPAQFGKGI